MISPNYSVYAIPMFYVMNLIPHFYSSQILNHEFSSTSWGVSPRSSTMHDSFRKRASTDSYARWERLRAAHNNGLETLPLLVAAVILGNMAKLNAAYMDGMIGAFVGLRAMYILAYVNTVRQKWTFVRSIIWGASTYLVIDVMIRAGNVLAHH